MNNSHQKLIWIGLQTSMKVYRHGFFILHSVWSPVPWAHAGFSYRTFPPMCLRSLQSRMTPCHLMRTECAPVATSPRVGWWASWSRLQSSSARSVPQRLLQSFLTPPRDTQSRAGPGCILLARPTMALMSTDCISSPREGMS